MQTTVTTPETLARTALPYRAWLPLARRLVATAWYPLALAAAVLILYAPSLGYPIHWDDPTWYAQGRGPPSWRCCARCPLTSSTAR